MESGKYQKQLLSILPTIKSYDLPEECIKKLNTCRFLQRSIREYRTQITTLKNILLKSPDLAKKEKEKYISDFLDKQALCHSLQAEKILLAQQVFASIKIAQEALRTRRCELLEGPKSASRKTPRHKEPPLDPEALRRRLAHMSTFDHATGMIPSFQLKAAALRESTLTSPTALLSPQMSPTLSGSSTPPRRVAGSASVSPGLVPTPAPPAPKRPPPGAAEATRCSPRRREAARTPKAEPQARDATPDEFEWSATRSRKIAAAPELKPEPKPEPEPEPEESQDAEETYCICQKAQAAAMVGCENPNCPYGSWFHFSCVGMNEKCISEEHPWYCPGCWVFELGRKWSAWPGYSFSESKSRNTRVRNAAYKKWQTATGHTLLDP
eukprot:gnl/Chilomastix_cuspidata/1782.p1 GENE.gnl/Chilomastix_cuspidata/1782~~gnl/Chilomastix_cuspidata/1782.p1  ORF type:complete len:382 (-),score=78.69 gnl/Chilomastix_cuspidata/1782:102-1247(-)